MVNAIKVDRWLSDKGEIVDEPSYILLADGKFEGVVDALRPSAKNVFDGSGFTALPGLIDAHLHLAMHNHRTFKNYRAAQASLSRPAHTLYALFHAQLCFDMGFTTVRDMGLARQEGQMVADMCAVRDAVNLGIYAGPNILVGGWALMTGGHLDRIMPRHVPRNAKAYADGPYALRGIVREHIRTGADFIKTTASGGFDSEGLESEITNHTQEELNAIGDEAHSFQKHFAVHCFTPRSQMMAITAGADTIEHCVFTDKEAVSEIGERGLPVIPTLIHRSDHAIEIRREMGTPDVILDGMKRLQPYCFETFQSMHRAGIKIAMGTDTGYDPGFGENALELELYVSLGMTPLEAILTATHNAADAIGLHSKRGRIQTGQCADLVLVKGNPFTDISLLNERNNIGLVMKDGQIHIDRIGDCRKEILPVSFDENRKYD